MRAFVPLTGTFNKFETIEKIVHSTNYYMAIKSKPNAKITFVGLCGLCIQIGLLAHDALIYTDVV